MKDKRRKNGKKIYFHTSIEDGTIAFTSRDRDVGSSLRFKIRFAGNPKFIISSLVRRNGHEEGLRIYKELIECMMDISNNGGFSPLVMYIYDKNNGKRNRSTKEEGGNQ